MGESRERRAMSEPIILASFDLDDDLRAITSHLWANGIGHRVVEQNNQQVLILANSSDAPQAHYWVDKWEAGKLTIAEVEPMRLSNNTLSVALKAPLTLASMAVLILMFVFQQFSNYWHDWLVLGDVFWPSLRNNPQVLLELGFWPVWRLSLLHFSVLHLVFNLVWWWVIGNKIEQKDGRFALLVLIVVSGYTGNLAQWWLTGPAFGGASGITMAMLGWVGWRQLQKKIDYDLPSILLPLMAGWMLFSIFSEYLFAIDSQTGHGAHVIGLASGLILSIFMPRKQINIKDN